MRTLVVVGVMLCIAWSSAELRLLPRAGGERTDGVINLSNKEPTSLIGPNVVARDLVHSALEKQIFSNGKEDMIHKNHLSGRSLLQEAEGTTTSSSGFDGLNELLSDMEIHLQDMSMDLANFGVNAALNLANIRASKVQIENIILDYEKAARRAVYVDVDIIGVSLDVNADYDYFLGIVLDGEGTVAASVQVGTMLRLALVSENLDLVPPTWVSLDKCSAEISLSRISFGGDDILGSFLEDVLKQGILDVVDGFIQDIACTVVEDVIGTPLEDILLSVADILDPHLVPLSSQDFDPLDVEKNLQVPEDVELYDFDLAVNPFLAELNVLLGTTATDPANVLGTGSDLLVNVLLREELLDEDRAFTLQVSEVVLLEELFEMSIGIDRVRIFGLDTLTRLEPLEGIGKHTLRSTMKWSSLAVEVDAVVGINLTTTPDDIVHIPAGVNLNESIRLTAGLEDLQVILAVMLAIDTLRFSSISLGPLLNSTTLLSCLLSSLYEAQVSSLDVSFGKFLEPQIYGLLSDGIDKLLVQLVQAVLLAYEGLFEKAVPSLFQVTVRNALNDIVSFLGSGNLSCPVLDLPDEAVDFRDLLLRPEIAAESGGSGKEPYGDLVPSIFTFLKDHFLSAQDADGLSHLNSLLVRPLTTSLSGKEGSIILPGEILDLTTEISHELLSLLVKSLRISVANVTVDHLDTLGYPLNVMLPNSTSGILLDNGISLGKESSPLQTSVEILIDLKGDPVLETQNVLQVGMEVGNVDLFAVLLAHIRQRKIFALPLVNFLDVDCILSTFLTPQLNEQGVRLPGTDPGLALDYIELVLSDFRLHMHCVACTSSQLQKLSDVMGLLDSRGLMKDLAKRLTGLVLEIGQSDFVQILLDRLLVSSSQRCPSSADYINGGALPLFNGPDFPGLTKNSLEGIFLAATTLLNVMVVVLISGPPEPYDPSSIVLLSGQETVELSEEMRLVDLTGINNISIVEEVKSFLEGPVADAGGPNGDSDLGVNVLVRDVLLDQDRTLLIMVDDMHIEMGGTEVDFGALRVRGLDTITRLGIFNVTGPQSIRNQIIWRQLRVELDLSVNSITIPFALNGTMSFGMHEVEASLSILLALDELLLSSVKLGSVLRTEKLLPCLLSTVFAAEVTELFVSFGKFDGLTLEGFPLSSSVQNTIRETTDLLLEKYEDDMRAALPSLLNVTARAVANKLIKYYLELGSFESCQMPMPLSFYSGFIDFRDLLLDSAVSVSQGGSGQEQYGDFIQVGVSLLNQLLEAELEDGLSPLNELLVAPVTKMLSGESGSFRMDGDLLDFELELDVNSFQGLVKLKLSDLEVENVDSLGAPLSIMKPVPMSPNKLNNTISLGAGANPLSMSARVLIEALDNDGLEIRYDVHLGIDLSAITIALTLLLKVIESRFVLFPLRDALNLNCWLATIPAPALDSMGIARPNSEPSASLSDLAIRVGHVSVNASCASCSGPDAAEAENLMDLLLPSLRVDDVNEVVAGILDIVTRISRHQFLRNQIDRLLAEAPKHCPHREEFDANAPAAEYDPFELQPVEYTRTYIYVVVAVLVCLTLAAVFARLLVKKVVRRRHGKWLRMMPAHAIGILYRHQKREDEEKAELNKKTRAMFRCGKIPWFIRGLVPVLFLGVGAMQCYSLVNVASVLKLQAKIFGEEFCINLYTYSFFKSTVDFWEAGAQLVVVCFLVCSLLIPFSSIILALALWFAPPRLMPVTTRGRIFSRIQTTVKWTGFAILYLNNSSLAYRFTAIDVFAVSVVIFLEPTSAFWVALGALLLLLPTACATAYLHDSVVNELRCSRSRDDTEELPAELHSNAREKLCKHAFTRVHRGKSDKLHVRQSGQLLIALLGLVVCTLTILGSFLTIFSVELSGLVGILAEVNADVPVLRTEYNLYSMMKGILDQGHIWGSAGMPVAYFCCALTFVTNVLTPLLECALLLSQWFIPLTMKKHRRTHQIIEITLAFQALDVFVFTMLVSMTGLANISEWTIKGLCDPFRDVLTELVFYGLLDKYDARCIRTNVSAGPGTYVLLAAVLCLAFMKLFVCEAYKQYEREQSLPVILYDDPRLREGYVESAVVETSELRKKIHPVPIQFSDTFRWFLVREQRHRSQTNYKSRSMPTSASDVKSHMTKSVVRTPSNGEGTCDDSTLPTETVENQEWHA